MIIFYGIAHYHSGFETSASYILLAILGLLLYLFPVLAINIVAQKNDITQKGTFTILLYAFLTAMLPYSLTRLSILLSNVFVLLALQNILHMRNEKNIKAKIFNASLYIGLASLSYFWSIGFITLLFFGILYFAPKEYRNWIIPFVGILTIFLFANCFTLVVYDSFFTYNEYVDSVSFSFQEYYNNKAFFSLGVLLLCTVFFFSIFLIKFRKKKANIKPILRILVVYLIIAIVIPIVSPQKNTSELLFLATPLAIIGTTYLEMSRYSKAKEFNIWVFICIPFTLLFF